ncbi:MAG: peptidoglycan-binding protein [Acidimicrobiales bacterium]
MGVGSCGDAVSDLQRRLASIGIELEGDTPGQYGVGTAQGVRRFQALRGLRPDGLCGPQTWSALVEAGYRPGDRLLYRKSPMLRGDDVADLQSRLSSLGFDTGRVDGIFGDNTARSLSEFQRNAGLVPDGVFGTATAGELARFQIPGSVPHLVTGVREREELRRTGGGVSGTTVAVGQIGDMVSMAATLERTLRQQGAGVLIINNPDGSIQAAQANGAGANLFLGLGLDPDLRACVTSYYSGYSCESSGGRHMASAIQSRVPRALGISDNGIRGMALPVLRETRMPAVVCELGPPAIVVERSALLCACLVDAVREWCSAFNS